jgi:hypothetical protein
MKSDEVALRDISEMVKRGKWRRAERERDDAADSSEAQEDTT